MKIVVNTCNWIFDQLSDVIKQIQDDHFTQPVPSLNKSTIGQHLRHTLEFFICLQRAIDKGVVNYDNRMHDKHLETSKTQSLLVIEQLREFINTSIDNHPLQLEVTYDLHNVTYDKIPTTVFRELVYNIEHAVHHMALIKIGIFDIAPYVTLPPEFGVAVSTLRYQNSVSN